MSAVAISNNDMVYLHWTVAEKIPHCLGFSVIRHDAKSGEAKPLPAMVGFTSDTREGSRAAGSKFRDTNVWPVQKYAWKDLFAARGGTYWYEIVPMLGKPGDLEPDAARTMRTNSVTLDPRRGDCSVFFNRGIISTQAVARDLSKSKKSGLPNAGDLKRQIANPGSKLRARLVGGLEIGVLELIERARNEGGECYCALYELQDKDLVTHLLGMGKKVHIVLSNAGEDTEEGAGDGDSTNVDARGKLHAAGIDVTDRMLKKGHIGHNKFVVYVKKNRPLAALSGSTNWTSTGLCAQSNNAVIVESPAVARDYLAYWNALKKDTKDADGDGTALQAQIFRTANRKQKSTHDLEDGADKAAGDVRVWFSPNTVEKS
ncbi:MAG TPA: phospholipase D-like domain-containing protein, partial [Rhodanobacteraceae bacterium]|nr:phospholipase D-like domain-containing protein [Rhodanobacteraceae bacterium]